MREINTLFRAEDNADIIVAGTRENRYNV